MPPSFDEFVAALRSPERRSSIRLVISDADAAALLARDDWAEDYNAAWVRMFPADGSAPDRDTGGSGGERGRLGVGAQVLLPGLITVCIRVRRSH